MKIGYSGNSEKAIFCDKQQFIFTNDDGTLDTAASLKS